MYKCLGSATLRKAEREEWKRSHTQEEEILEQGGPAKARLPQTHGTERTPWEHQERQFKEGAGSKTRRTYSVLPRES